MKRIILFLCIGFLCASFLGCASTDKKEIVKQYLAEQMVKKILEDSGYNSLILIITEIENLEKLKSNNEITEEEYEIKQKKLLKALDKFKEESKDEQR